MSARFYICPPFGVLNLNELMLSDVRDYLRNLATSNRAGRCKLPRPYFCDTHRSPPSYIEYFGGLLVGGLFIKLLNNLSSQLFKFIRFCGHVVRR